MNTQRQNLTMAGTAVPTTDRTLAQRLESSLITLSGQADRIEAMLSRVNGTPQDAAARHPESGMTAPLTEMVSHAEMLSERMIALASGLERIS